MGVTCGTRCTFKACGNYSRASGLSFFTFPKETERCRRWIVKSQRTDLLELFDEIHTKDMTYFNRNHTLCSDHFEDHCFMNAREKKRLLRSAIPTIFVNRTSVQKPSTRKFKTGKRGRRAQPSSSAATITRTMRPIRPDLRDDAPPPLVINMPNNMASPVIINIPGAKNSPLIINVANGEVYTSVDDRVDLSAVKNSISLDQALTGGSQRLTAMRSVCPTSLDAGDIYPEDEREMKYVPPPHPGEWREYRTGHLTPYGANWDESSHPRLQGQSLKLKKVRLQQQRCSPRHQKRCFPELEDRKPALPYGFPVKMEPFGAPLVCLSSSSDDSNSEGDLDQTTLDLTSQLRRFRTHRDIVRSSLGPVSPASPSRKPRCGGPASSPEEVIRRMAFAPPQPLPNYTSNRLRRSLDDLKDKIHSFDFDIAELTKENQLLSRELYIYRSKRHLYREKLRKVLRNIRAKETRKSNNDSCALHYCQERLPLSTFKFFKCQLLSCKCPQWDFDSMQIPVIAKRCGLGVRETFYQILRMPSFRTFTNYRNILKKNPLAVEEGNLVRDDLMGKFRRKLERKRRGPREPSRTKKCKSISTVLKDYLQRNDEGVAWEQ